MRNVIFLIALLSATPCTTHAQDQSNLEFSLGMVFSHFENPLLDSKTRNLVLPSMNFTYYSKRFFIDEEVGYVLWEGRKTLFNLIGSLNLDFIYFLDKSETLKDLRSRHPSFLAGLEMLYFPIWGEIQLQYLQDIVNVHDGQEFVFSYRTDFQFGNWLIVPKAGLHWKSPNLIQYYYGTDERDGDAFPIYRPNSGINTFAALEAEYPVDYHWIVGGFLHYTELAEEIRQSPITQKNHTFTAALGVKYLF